MSRLRDPRAGPRAPLFAARAAALAIAVAWAGACNCQDGRVAKHDKHIGFRFPAPGAVLTAADDENPQVPGIQVDVVAGVTAVADGTAVVLTNDVDVDGTGAPLQTRAEVKQGRVSFPSYTVPLGEVTLRAALPTGGTGSCDGQSCAEVSVTVVEQLCNFVTPKDGDVLTADSYPNPNDLLDPFEIDVTLECFGVPAGGLVALVVQNGLPLVTPMGETPRVSFLRVPLAEGTNQLEARAGTDAAGGAPAGGATRVAVTVETPRCTASLAPPEGTRLLSADDVDLDGQNGMQANLVLVTDCSQDSTAELYARRLGEVAFVQLVPAATEIEASSGVSRFTFLAVPLEESLQPFDIQVVGRVFSTGAASGVTVPVRYWVDSQPPVLHVESPSRGACLGPAEDADPGAAGLQIHAAGLLSGAEDGAEVRLGVAPMGETPAACAADADCQAPAVCRQELCVFTGAVDDAAFGIEVTLPPGASELRYRGFDLAGNASAQASLEVFAVPVPPTVVIDVPTSGALLGAAADLSTEAGLQIVVELHTGDAPAGAKGSLSITGQAPVAFEVGDDGVALVPVTLEVGERVLVAEVLDACGGVAESDAVAVTAAPSLPPLVVTAYDGRSGGFAHRRVVDDGALTAAPTLDLDVFLGPSSRTRTLAITRHPGFAGSPRVCTGLSTQISAGPVATAADGLLLSGASGVNLPEGTSCFSFSLNDGVNAAQLTYVVERRSVAPVVALTQPAAGPVSDGDGDPANGVTVNLEVTLSGGAGAGGGDDGPGKLELRLMSGAALVARWTVPVAGDSALVELADASLPAGSFELVALYTDALGNQSTSAPVALSAGGAAPIVLTAPVGGAELPRASFGTTVTRLGASVDLQCDLELDGAPVLADLAWPAASPPLTASLDPVAWSEGPHLVRARCDDQPPTFTRYSQSAEVILDDTPPPQPALADEPGATPGRLVFSEAGAYVNASVADTSSLAGLQHAVAVLVFTDGQDPTGWRVVLTVDPPALAPTSYERVMGADAGDPTAVRFPSVNLGAADGAVSFSAVVFDRAGNASPAAAAVLTIDRTRPVITQLVPAPDATAFGPEDDADDDPLYVDLGFSYLVEDAALSDEATLFVLPRPPAFAASATPAPIVAGEVGFGPLPFSSGSFLARLVALDDAGNVAEHRLAFEVAAERPALSFSIPAVVDPGQAPVALAARDDSSEAPGLPSSFALLASGLAAGTEVVLCSTAAPLGAATPCRWGRDGVLGGADAGVVVATGALSGTTFAASVLFADVDLAEGSQILHGEARELDGSPDVASSFVGFVVDALPPEVLTLGLPSNDDANDGEVIRLGAAEGVVAGASLLITVEVTAAGAAPGAPVRILSSPGSAVLAAGTLDVASHASLTVPLTEGDHTLWAEVEDAAGNTSGSMPSLAVLADFEPGTAAVVAPAAVPLSAAHGAAGGCPGAGSLATTVEVELSDRQPVAGGQVVLRRFSAPTGGSAEHTSEAVPVGASAVASFDAFPVPQGTSYLEASYTDAAGNLAVSPRQAFTVDVCGPSIALRLLDAVASEIYCDSPSCAPAQEPDAAGRVRLVRATNDLVFSLSGCSGQDSGVDPCSPARPLSFRLLSRLSADDDFAPVYRGGFGAGADQVDRSLFDEAPGWALEPGAARQVMLEAVDHHGNRSTSAVLSFVLAAEGVAVEVERSGDAGPTGVLLEDDAYLGAADRLVASAPEAFLGRFRVRLLPSAGRTPEVVRLEVSDPGVVFSAELGVAGTPLGQSSVDFDAVPLTVSADPDSPVPNTITIEIDCAEGALCGGRDFIGVVADVTAPGYELDRCSLCALGVPIGEASPGVSFCTQGCGAANGAAPAGNLLGSASPAQWNLDGGAPRIADADGRPDTGWNTPAPLVVRVLGAEPGRPVELRSSQGGLAGAHAETASCAAGVCTASFPDLSLSSLAAGLHDLTVHLEDRAGNQAAALTARGNETLFARVDVVPPSDVEEIVCLGEATLPTGATASEAPAAWEHPACAAACLESDACDRRAGEATLLFAASPPGEGVAGYRIRVAALGVPYAGGLAGGAAGCEQITPEQEVELELSESFSLPGAGGALGFTPIRGLLPHRAYCFRVEPRDDMGNAFTGADPDTERRDLPLVTHPSIGAFSPHTAYDSLMSPPALFSSSVDPGFGDLGAVAASAGDLDGDGHPELAFAQTVDSAGAVSEVVAVFSGAGDPTAPSWLVMGPAATSGSASGFGKALVGGDFDGDGFSDLAICAPAVDSAGAGAAGGPDGGALFLYYGGPLGLGVRQNPGDPLLPSLLPDVALFGPAGHAFCGLAALGEVDAAAGTDLVVGSAPSSSAPRVYGFSGGSRPRFVGNTPAKLLLALAQPASPGISNRADFSLSPRSAGASGFPSALALANVDGDVEGRLEVVVADAGAHHAMAGTAVEQCAGCGEIYVYGGAVDLVGVVAAPDSAPPELLHTVRFAGEAVVDGAVDTSDFGATLIRLPAPRGDVVDAGDWLAATVQTPEGRRVVVLVGSSDTSGLSPASYPAGGAALGEYVLLDATDFAGDAPSPSTAHGGSLAALGDFEARGVLGLAVAPGASAADAWTFIYAYDPDEDRFEKRALLQGEPGMGAAVVGAGDFLGLGGLPQLVLVKLTAGPAASFFVYR